MRLRNSANNMNVNEIRLRVKISSRRVMLHRPLGHVSYKDREALLFFKKT